MKIVAFVPIKLNNQRLPGKNLLPLGGKPLCKHLFQTLSKIPNIDKSYVFCSDGIIKQYMPSELIYLERSPELDGNTVKGADIYRAFISEVEADYYMLLHATSPFTSTASIEKAIEAVKSGKYDSAFTAERIQTFAWYKGSPINYSPEDVPRTQDLDPIWVETSGFYLFSRELFLNTGRRIGNKPYIVEVSNIEAIDIDEKKDYELACKLVGGENDG